MRQRSFSFKCGAQLLRMLCALLLLCGEVAYALDPASDPGQLSRRTWQTETGLPQNTVHSVTQTRDGYIWVATEEGVARFDGLGFVVFDRQNTPQLRSNDVRALLATESALWACTAEGLSRFRGGAWETFTTEQGLGSNDVVAASEGLDGSIWVATTAGLSHLEDGASDTFKTFTTRDGLAGDNVQALYGDGEGTLWVGTSAGLVRFGAGRFTSFNAVEGLSDGIILSIFEDREGSLWVGTESGGLHQLRGRKFTAYTTREGLSSDLVKAIYEDRAGNLWLWVGTRGGLAHLEGGVFKTYTTRDGLPNDFVGTIYEDASGVLWVGTLGGLSRFADGRFTSYTTRDGLSDNVVISIHGDREGRLLVGTNGGGLNLFKDGRFYSFTTRDGLPNDTIYRILEDSRGRLWMSCNKGIFRLTMDELEEFASGKSRELHPVVYGTADGMPTRECSGGGHPSGWRGADGRLWFSTIKGVATIDPERVAQNNVPPPVVIEQLRVDGEPVPGGARSELPPGKSRFDFYYAGLSFVAPEKVRYRYKLEGFDKDWVEGGDRRVAYYTNLGPGDYRFLVVACNNDGVWSQTPASFAFTLKPHFYRTYWFYALCAVGLGLAAWQLYALRVRQMRARFAAVLQERNRIAREIHDNLAQEILGVSVQLEIVARLMSVSTETARTHLDRARALVRSSIAEARRYVWDLRSQSLDERDLPAALAEMTRRLTAESEVQTQFEVSGTFRALPTQVENNLLRIGQEAVNNAVRHARARTICVNLTYDAESVRLSVSDDGCGFDPAPFSNGSGGHFGIVGMRERAEALGGTLHIGGRPGEGSEVSVCAPVDGQATRTEPAD